MSKIRLFALFFASAVWIFGQGERATISGTVTDSTGALVPQARISVRNESTNIVNRAESNSSGLYVVPALEPGSYELTAEKQGFRSYKVSSIPLSVGLTATVDVKLEVGLVSEAVQVTAAAAQLE